MISYFYYIDGRMFQWTKKNAYSSSYRTNGHWWKIGEELFQASVRVALYYFVFHVLCLLKNLYLYANLYISHIYYYHRLQRTNKEGTSSRERTAAFGLIMPGGPPPALPGDHSVLLPSIASQTSMREWLLRSFFCSILLKLLIKYRYPYLYRQSI